MKFGYPIKLRSADFYAPDKNESELHLREDSFVNDSIRSAHQSRRASIIPQYNALDDPHLRRFFQTPIVLDVVRKTLNMDGKQLAKIYQIKKRSKSVKISNRCVFRLIYSSRTIPMTNMLKIINELSVKVHQAMRN